MSRKFEEKKKFLISVIIVLVIAFLMLAITGIVYLSQKNANKPQWEGKYVGSIDIYDEGNENRYTRFRPLVEIDNSTGNYIISISTRATRKHKLAENSGDNTAVSSFQKIELADMDEDSYIFEAKFLHSEVNDAVTYIELQYDTEKVIRFRHASTKEELEEKEFITLNQIPWDSQG